MRRRRWNLAALALALLALLAWVQARPGYTNICALLYDAETREVLVYYTTSYCPDVEAEEAPPTGLMVWRGTMKPQCVRWAVFRAVKSPRVLAVCP